MNLESGDTSWMAAEYDRYLNALRASCPRRTRIAKSRDIQCPDQVAWMAQEPEGAERKAVPRVQTEQTAFERTQQLKYLISKRAIGGGLAVFFEWRQWTDHVGTG
jgi:hypothetical protein